MRNIKEEIKKEVKTVPFNSDDGYCEDRELSKREEVKLQEGIGKLLMSFSFLEQSLNDALCYLINNRTDSVGILIIRKMFFKQKLNLYKDMIFELITNCVSNPAKNKRILDKANNIIRKAEELSEFRNRIVHTDWTTVDIDNFYTVSIETDNKKETNIHYKKMKITPSIIIKFVRQNEALRDKLYELVEDIYQSI